jgi:hypothetical protein
MFSLAKTAHVLAVGLWFGAAVFFTASGVLMNRAFEELSSKPDAAPAPGSRPAWFPVPDLYRHAPLGPGFPDPSRKEQGSRAFGVAVRPLFPFYYALQLGCGLVALLAAAGLAWPPPRKEEGGRRKEENREAPAAPPLARLRVGLCAFALLSVAVGWWVETVVADLRGPREQRTDDALRATNPTPELLAEARGAREAFVTWHGFSLLQNFTTLAVVAVLTGMAAHLPGRP